MTTTTCVLPIGEGLLVSGLAADCLDLTRKLKIYPYLDKVAKAAQAQLEHDIEECGCGPDFAFCPVYNGQAVQDAMTDLWLDTSWLYREG